MKTHWTWIYRLAVFSTLLAIASTTGLARNFEENPLLEIPQLIELESLKPKSHINDTETKSTKADKNKTASGKTDTNTTKTKSKDDKETGSKKSKTHKSKTKKETTNEAETEITNELVYVVRMSAPSAISHSKQTSTAADYFSQFKCDPPCGHGGLCFRDTCLCKGRYYGPTCEKYAPPLVKINMIMFWSICVGLFLFGLLFSLIAAKAIVSLHARATNSVPNLQKRDIWMPDFGETP